MLPYEMTIAVLVYLSPAQILNLNLPFAYQKSVLFASNSSKVNERIRRRACDRSDRDPYFYYKQFIKFNFINKKIICEKCIRVTFDGRFVVTRDILMCFINQSYIKHLLRDIDSHVTLQQLVKIYSPEFKFHINSKIEFVSIECVLASICLKHSYGKCEWLDKNIKTVCLQLRKICKHNSTCLSYFIM
ncbi:Mv-ORF33 peptide [Maruca vitrata nucleopolyhedrovirus]|uniref:Mv-ORF33 peptide n=1 Tax=Maruca vitrata nucleopolyhedrovirus TaxID=1307954 RepID=A1YR95_9ABAC|nr:Mv-ORF33 peptide [Maruca vitrata nucleopolyhedrovirus]ABL75985.1 Mv-ORF33 peptide [Maruca vitrata nucleopolyhedrovirus]